MEFVLKIGAQAGAGVMVTGRMAAKCFTRAGYSVVGYPEYPSLVRGGHNAYQIRASDNGINAPVQHSDVVVALNKDAVFYHKDFVSKKGSIVYDSTLDISKFKIKREIKLYPVPLMELIKKAGGIDKMRNTVALAAALALVDYPFEILESVITDEFKRKGEEIVKKNVAAAKAGYDYIKEKTAGEFKKKMEKVSDKKKLLVGGNEACALGAVKGGMKFYSAYPMTPASNILHYLCANERKFNIVVKQTEDEIAAMNYAIGANFAGVRGATGTSGGGFALMTEAFGMAALSETPLVAFLVQRVGPSTGMPTWTEQADLRFALHASQGDFLRVILAPGDVNESFLLSAKAFNLAEKYQLPVIVISDKFLAESVFSTDGFEENKVKIERGKIKTELPVLKSGERYKRYLLTDDGVSPRVFPGTENGVHISTSYEHDETGFSSESFAMRTKQADKREKKLAKLLQEMDPPTIYGPKKADVTLVTWGSHKLPALDAMQMLETEGVNVNVIHFTHIFPIEEKAVKKIIDSCNKTVLIENNSTAQFGGILKQYAGIEFDFHLLKYDGRPVFPEQIVHYIKKLVKSGFKGKKVIKFCEKEDLEYYNPQRHGLM